MEASESFVPAYKYELSISLSLNRGESRWIKEIYIPSEGIAFNIAKDIIGKESLNIFESNGSRMELKKRKITPSPHLSQKEIDVLCESKPNARNVEEITLDSLFVSRIKEIKHHQDEAKRQKNDLFKELKPLFTS